MSIRLFHVHNYYLSDREDQDVAIRDENLTEETNLERIINLLNGGFQMDCQSDSATRTIVN